MTWRPIEGLSVTGNYSFTDQFFKDLNEPLSTGTAKTPLYLQRAGLRIPAVPQHQFVGRVGYDIPYGDFKGFGGFIKYVQRSDAPLDNANIVWAPGYGVVNLDLHYNREIENSFFKKIGVYFQVKNLFDRTYFTSAAVVSDSLISGTIVQQPSSVLSNSISVIPATPRAFVGGVRLKF